MLVKISKLPQSMLVICLFLYIFRKCFFTAIIGAERIDINDSSDD